MMRGTAIAGLVLTLAVALLPAPVLGASRPAVPVILEPAAQGQVVHPANVHMATAEFADMDGDAHHCTTWAIHIASTGRRVWSDKCDTVSKLHVHLGDGKFVGPYAGRTQLKFGVKYVLRVRHAQLVNGRFQWSAWAERRFWTSKRAPAGTSTAWTFRQPGFALDVFATGLTLPVNIAFAPSPPAGPGDPFIYVAELHGAIKVVAKDGTVTDYFNNALNYEPSSNFPGTGEQGLAGLVVDPVTGDVFASMLYQADDGQLYAKVVRFYSAHGGALADGSSVVIDMAGEPMNFSHQISNLTIGPDGMLYVHMGDGFAIARAQDVDSFRGKILRMSLDGDAPPDNPFYDASDGISARDYVFAYGFRNPFGGTWRAADGAHYTVENGPTVDRFATIVAGRNYLWDGTDESMLNHAAYVWNPAVAPINVAFVESEAWGGSGFPAERLDRAFVTESGPTWLAGPAYGKRITEFAFDSDGTLVSGPQVLLEYTGTGRASVAGIAAGPDGLYFTDLYRDQGAAAATDCCAQLLRIRWVGN